ncbi:unnamed protein product [Penicillium egyptiacum]|uniref:Zn(2)-C6 fungal-type domain-containing protein n=1 Tax=Penicillium egyptiacum TaxID=1303716 RepID=A0A9W4KMJ2_9EURO|nr:unnamed protein product [Penicillium egyptiacum]
MTNRAISLIMSQLTSPTCAPVDSILACVHCARSKAKCDRKVPCSRCRVKKLTCQARVPQRGQGRSSANNKSKPPPPTNTNESSDTVESEPVTSTTDGGPNTTSQYYPTGNGLYMDWSHSAIHKWARNRPGNTLEADSLARFIAAAPRVDESYHPNLSLSSHPMPGMLGTADDFDFVVPTRVPSPAAQLPNFSGMPSWNPAFSISPGMLARSTNDDGDDLMDHYLPASSLFPSLEASLPDYDQFHTLEGWPLFQCNPITPSSACAPTAANHVKNLDFLLRGGNIPIQQCHAVDSHTAIESLLVSTRENLIAVLQWLCTEAQELYGLRGQDDGIPGCSVPSIMMLPSPPVLDTLLRAYFTSYEPYYPFIPTMSLNEHMDGRCTNLQSMRIFLMLAGGGMTAGAGEACVQLAHGLLEICRISLRKLTEQNVILALDHEVSQCALLNLLVSAWSGDKWQMDHHDDRQAQVARIESFDNVAQSWEAWKEQERANRTTHAWLILDHEICLFQDAPSISFFPSASLNTPIPSMDAAWRAQSAKHWIEQMALPSGQVIIPPSLGEWIGWFSETISETTNFSATVHISPITLRLLLCHLQNQVIQLRSTMGTVAGRGSSPKGPQHMSIVLHSVQVQTVQELLHKWYELAKIQPNETATPATASNMMLYHLIMLNVIVCFPDIEHLARSGGDSKGARKRPLHKKHAYHLENPRQIYFHCGQVLRHVRTVPEPARPPWWAGAVYRVALITWANGMVCADGDDAQNRRNMKTETTVALDMLTPDHASIVNYLNNEAGIPVFADLNGAKVPLDNSVGILQHFARFLQTDIKTKFTFGVQRKLLTMARRWESGTTQNLQFAI